MHYIIGIDEVGRGSLAGPVAVAAVAIPKNFRYSKKLVPCELRDSKRLTQKQREAWYRYLTQHPSLCYSKARVYPRRIEKLNIAKAANIAALRALERLSKTQNLTPKTCRILLDGGLYLGNTSRRVQTTGQGSAKKVRVHPRDVPRYSASTLVRGDERIPAIQMASIIAKVSRDRFMVKLAKQYPVYGFDIHKGYGTKAHFAAIRKHGPSEAHRLTFLSRRYSMS